jgi:hypothetical protein
MERLNRIWKLIRSYIGWEDYLGIAILVLGLDRSVLGHQVLMSEIYGVVYLFVKNTERFRAATWSRPVLSMKAP